MLFTNKSNGKDIELFPIQNCDFWEDHKGNLFAIDYIRLIAWSVKPSDAIKCILMRKEKKNIAVDPSNDLQVEISPN